MNRVGCLESELRANICRTVDGRSININNPNSISSEYGVVLPQQCRVISSYRSDPALQPGQLGSDKER